MTDAEHADLLRRAAPENAIASGELEGLVYTPATRELLERDSRHPMSDAEFRRAAMALIGAKD